MYVYDDSNPSNIPIYNLKPSYISSYNPNHSYTVHGQTYTTHRTVFLQTWVSHPSLHFPIVILQVHEVSAF